MNGFWCFHCSALSYSPVTCCIYCGREEGIPEIDLSELSDVGNSNFGISEPEGNAITTQKNFFKETEDANFPNYDSCLDIRERNSTEINSNLASDSSTNKRVTMFAGPQGGEKISVGVEYKNFIISSPQKDSRVFGISSGGTRGNLVFCDTVSVQNKKRKTPENNPADEGCRDEICSESGQDILQDSQQRYEPIQFGATGPISIYNSSLVYIDQKLSTRFSDSEASKGLNINDVLAVAGPSGLQGNQQHRNLHARIPHSNYVSEIPHERMREQYVLTCKVCKKDVGEHLVTEQNVYRCCVCKFIAFKYVYLQMHSYTHCHKKTCNICGKEYREGDLHDSEHTCDSCKNQFYCRTLYGEHLLGHDGYLKAHCWACSKHYSYHWIIEKEEKLYACCFCNYGSIKASNFKFHIVSHRPRLYCRICREEYRTSEKSLHGGNFMCLFCLNNYQCQTQLEDHIRRDHDDFCTLPCPMCGQRIDEHITRHGIECCMYQQTFSSEIALQKHPYEHTGLRLFKCDRCVQRFRIENLAINHSARCTVNKCEICGVVFLSSDYVDMHRSVIHIQI